MAQNELDIIIKVQSDMKKQMDANTKAVEQMRKKTEKSVNSIEQKFRNLGKVIQGVMGSAVIKAGATMIKTAEKQSASLAVLRTKSEEVYNQLLKTSDATFGMANKFDMVNAANKAMSFGIDLSNGRLEKLMNLSAKTARVMGTDVKSAFDDLITGVARESKMILDNLGVMVNLTEVYSNYADELGVTTQELTKAQRQTALLDEVNKKLQESTKDITNEMMETGSKGTQAIKTLETAFTTSINVMSQGVVWFGTQIGEELAKKHGATIDFLEKAWVNFNSKLIEQEQLTLKEFKQLRKISDAQDRERRRDTVLSFRKMHKDIIESEKKLQEEKRAIAKDTTKTFNELLKQEAEAEERHKVELITIAKSYGLTVKNARELDFVDFELMENKRHIVLQRNLNRMEKAVKNSGFYTIYKGVSKVVSDVQSKIDAEQKAKLDKQAAFWEKNGKTILAGRKKEVDELIKLEKELADYTDLNNVDKLNADKKYKERSLRLVNQFSLKKIQALRAAKALELDTKIQGEDETDVAEGLKLLWGDTKSFFNQEAGKFAEERKKTLEETLESEYQSKLKWNEQTQKMLDDYAKREADKKKKANREEQIEKEKHFGMMKRFGSDYLDAIISGNADKIPEILSQQAMMFGQELVWDGIKTLWMGTAKNALFPGLGASAMAVGATEIAIGAGMMGAGYAGSSALSSGSGDSGSNERNTARSNEDQNFNFNVTTSLYGSEVKAKREIRKIVS